MRHSVWLARLSAGLLLLGCPAMAADPNTPGSTIMIANPGASGPPFASKPASTSTPVPVQIIGTLPIATGAATSALQTAGNASLATIATNTTGAALDASIQQLLTKLNAGLTVSWTGQSVSLTGTLPAFAATPTFNLGTLNGASTAANQATEITSLGTIATNSGTQATAANQTTGNTSAATTATNTTAISTASGAIADAAYAGSGSSSIIAALKGIYARLGSVLTVTTSPAASTTLDPDVSTVTTGGTAVNAFSANHCLHGCYVLNPDNATQLLCGRDTGVASGAHSSAGTACAPPGGQVTFSATTNAISVVSSDSAHPFAGKGSN